MRSACYAELRPQETSQIPPLLTLPTSNRSRNGKANWSNGFLPAQYQAVAMAAQQPLRNLARPASIGEPEEKATRDFLRILDEQNATRHPGESELRARMASYELAARMQLMATTPGSAGGSSKSYERRRGFGTFSMRWRKTEMNPDRMWSRGFRKVGDRWTPLSLPSSSFGASNDRRCGAATVSFPSFG